MHNANSRNHTLTTRELEVLTLAATGAPSRTIADELGVTEPTVKSHLQGVYRKLGVSNRVAATRWYLERHGLEAR